MRPADGYHSILPGPYLELEVQDTGRVVCNNDRPSIFPRTSRRSKAVVVMLLLTNESKIKLEWSIVPVHLGVLGFDINEVQSHLWLFKVDSNYLFDRRSSLDDLHLLVENDMKGMELGERCTIESDNRSFSY